MSRSVTVLAVGPSVTVQDPGRPGLAHLGVPRSGWLDAPAAQLANRLVGNPDEVAVLECVLGGLTLRAETAMTLAVTGAPVEVRVDGRPAPFGAAVSVRAGHLVVVGTPARGLRCYVAVSGGFDVRPVLGSRATDTLSGIGPAPVRAGDLLPVGRPHGPPRPGEQVGSVPSGRAVLRFHPGPRVDWFDADALDTLTASPYVVSPDSDRVGLRLTGTPLRRSRTQELPSEGVVLGAVQVPPSGEPVVFLRDHPTTGGYPVIAVVLPEDVALCAQLRPGDEVSFRLARQE